MQITPLSIPDILLLQPKIFADERGFFFESFNQKQFNESLNKVVHFVQDNHSYSVKNVLRGLHYQVQQPQGKLVRVISGTIFDVAIDIRPHSPHFGQYVSALLSAEKQNQLWIPEGFAHGFLVLSNSADVLYKTTAYWRPEYERCIAWHSAELAIPWPIQETLIVSTKDQQGLLFNKTMDMG